MFRPMRSVVAGLAAAGLLGGAALADVSGFLGTWINSESGPSGFLGSVIGAGTDDGQIARIVTTPAGMNAVRIHLYGRCDPECDWGSQVGHNHMAGPDSDEIRSISADFSTGNSVKHLTLRKGPGNSLRFEVVTDFTGRTDKHDYEASGALRFAPPALAVTTSVPGAPTGAPAAPALRAVGDIPEDCARINPADVYVAPSNRGWKVKDFDHTILDYGTDKLGALKASRVLEYYRFDEQCYIVRPKARMIYWRVAGQIPRDSMPGEDCVEVKPQAVSVSAGKVMDGQRVVVDFEGDANAAAQAASVIRAYRLNRQCYADRSSDKLVYWLSR